MEHPHYSISTPENVDLHLELAGLGSRIWAAFIDMCLIYLIIIMFFLLAVFGAVVIELLKLPTETKALLYTWGVILIAVIGILVTQFGYFIYFEKVWNGQTPGKRIAQIRVIDANGQPVNMSSIIIRNLLRIVDTILALGVVVMIFDKNERRIGDFLGGTLVIRERQAELSARNLKISASLPSTSFVDAGQISPDEYHLLVDFLRRRQSMNPSSRALLARRMEEFFRQKLKPEKEEGESSEYFLEKVYLAYSNISQGL